MAERRPIRENLTTLQKHLRSKKAARDAAADVSGVLEAIALAGKSIAHKVRRARIDDVLGDAGEINLHGERQQKLDVIADDLLLHCLSERPDVAAYASEERDDPVVLRPRSDGGRYCVVVDPLDGSSNVDVAVSVGTIFSILPNEEADDATASAALQAGTSQLAAGYILYGSSVLMVCTTGAGVDMYVLDPLVGEFVLVQEGLRIPAEKKIYSVNEAYRDDFDDGIQAYLDFAHRSGYASRYIGSMVADVHRTLLKGGVFLYPPTTRAPNGKLRLLYEGNPMALVIEQAGGVAADGRGRILEVAPGELHQRTPVILGSPVEVEHVTKRL
jgi:fructose-1,6-bisphosphatase I